MDNIHLCELCQWAYEPKVIKGVRELKTFKGYFVDLRLQQFRKAVYEYPVFGDMIGISLDFVDFASPKGKRLLALMHEKVTR